MTVERTRQIFGDKFAHMTNQEVLAFISNMSIIADEMLKYALTELTANDKHSSTKRDQK